MKTTINVKGMVCKSCEMILQESVEEMPGVDKVQVSEKKGTVYVEFNEAKTNIEKISSVIKMEGYEVEE